MNRSVYMSSKNNLDKVKCDISQGLTLQFIAKSNSMRPFIVANRDQIILQKVDSFSFQKGAILFAELGKRHHVAHRIIAVNGDNLVLKGDAHLRHTQMCGRCDIIAEVVAIVRKGKLIKRGSFTWSLYRLFWPKAPLLRNMFLKIYALFLSFNSKPTKECY